MVIRFYPTSADNSIYSTPTNNISLFLLSYRSQPLQSYSTSVAFTLFKIANFIKAKDCVPRYLRSCAVHRFNGAECNSVHISEGNIHLLECLSIWSMIRTAAFLSI